MTIHWTIKTRSTLQAYPFMASYPFLHLHRKVSSVSIQYCNGLQLCLPFKHSFSLGHIKGAQKLFVPLPLVWLQPFGVRGPKIQIGSTEIFNSMHQRSNCCAYWGIGWRCWKGRFLSFGLHKHMELWRVSISILSSLELGRWRHIRNREKMKTPMKMN